MKAGDNVKKESKAKIAVFITPTIVMYSLLVIIPVICSVYFSLTDWNGIGSQNFTGIKNFTQIFSDPDFITSFQNTLICTVISILFQIPIGLVISYILYRGIKWFKIFRSIFFLPVVIAPIAIGVMFSLFFNGQTGALNYLLGAVGLQGLQKAWLSDSSVVLYSVISPQVWQFIGLYVIIFIAAFQTIPDEVIESAQIDGASSPRIFFKIACPMIQDVIKLAVILCFTGSMKSFDYSWIMTMGGPGYQSSYLGVYMFKSTFVNSNFGVGSATTVVIFATALLFTVLFGKLTEKNSLE